jgi:hypothetical protein
MLVAISLSQKRMTRLEGFLRHNGDVVEGLG